MTRDQINQVIWMADVLAKSGSAEWIRAAHTLRFLTARIDQLEDELRVERGQPVDD